MNNLKLVKMSDSEIYKVDLFYKISIILYLYFVFYFNKSV